MTFSLRLLCLCFSLLCLPLLYSCASINPTSVADEDRDLSGQFDGRWKLTERPLRSTQVIAGRHFKCNFYERDVSLRVKDGVGRLGPGVGNVGKNGRFRIVIPTDRFFTSTDGPRDEGNRIMYVYQGKLSTSDKTTGLFTKGKKSMNNSGCSTRLTIEKAS